MVFFKWQNSEGNWLICNVDNPNNGIDIDLTEEQADYIMACLDACKGMTLDELAAMAETR